MSDPIPPPPAPAQEEHSTRVREALDRLNASTERLADCPRCTTLRAELDAAKAEVARMVSPELYQTCKEGFAELEAEHTQLRETLATAQLNLQSVSAFTDQLRERAEQAEKERDEEKSERIALQGAALQLEDDREYNAGLVKERDAEIAALRRTLATVQALLLRAKPWHGADCMGCLGEGVNEQGQKCSVLTLIEEIEAAIPSAPTEPAKE